MIVFTAIMMMIVTTMMVCMMTGFCRDTSRCICSFYYAFTSDHSHADDDAHANYDDAGDAHADEDDAYDN